MKLAVVNFSLFFLSFNFFCQDGFLIETPEMQVFYEGIPIELRAWASGDYKKVNLSVPSPYTAVQGMAGKTITVVCTGINKKGETVSLGSKTFLVKKAPKPQLYWNGVKSGETANKKAGILTCEYDDNVPFGPWKGKFNVDSYFIIYQGSEVALTGVGSTISDEHLEIIKNISGTISIQANVSGTFNGLVEATFN